MAFYIKIEKTVESDSTVRYSFESDRSRRGLLEIDKKTGEALVIEPMPEDERMHCFNRAAVKIIREWKQGRFPQLMEWAS